MATVPITFTDGNVLFASQLNTNFESLETDINNLTPLTLQDYSASLVQMKSEVSPGANGSESPATTLAGEIERLRYTINRIVGKTNWLDAPSMSIEQLVTAGFLDPVGSYKPYGGVGDTPPDGYLFGDNSAVSRATYAALWAAIHKEAAVTITIASPAVVTWSGHGLADGAPVFLTTTGSLPTGIVATTTYYAKVINANTFNLTAEQGPQVTATVTITIAAPGVITWDAHGFEEATPISFTTTGALPTGLTAGTTYYVKSPTISQFQVSATPGGAAIVTSGTQSGTHTGWYAKELNTSGSQVGTHTCFFAPHGGGDFSTTFNVPDLRHRSLMGYDSSDSAFNYLGRRGGTKRLSLHMLPEHPHTVYDPGHVHTLHIGAASSGSGLATGSQQSLENRMYTAVTGIAVTGGGRTTPKDVYPEYVTCRWLVKY